MNPRTRKIMLAAVLLRLDEKEVLKRAESSKLDLSKFSVLELAKRLSETREQCV